VVYTLYTRVYHPRLCIYLYIHSYWLYTVFVLLYYHTVCQFIQFCTLSFQIGDDSLFSRMLVFVTSPSRRALTVRFHALLERRYYPYATLQPKYMASFAGHLPQRCYYNSHARFLHTPSHYSVHRAFNTHYLRASHYQLSLPRFS